MAAYLIYNARNYLTSSKIDPIVFSRVLPDGVQKEIESPVIPALMFYSDPQKPVIFLKSRYVLPAKH